jgi:hypothetical protein
VSTTTLLRMPVLMERNDAGEMDLNAWLKA